MAGFGGSCGMWLAMSAASDRTGGFSKDLGLGLGLGSNGYVIVDLCRRSGRIQLISPQEEDHNAHHLFGDSPLPALLEEDEEEEEDEVGQSVDSSRTLADHGDGCNYSDEDDEELDALLASSDADDDGDSDEEEGCDDGDSLKSCARSKRGRIRQKFQRLRTMVGADRCMDTVAVFDEAIQCLKALQLQIRSHDSHGIVLDG